jgi:putative SOS response-associated peptidase YedK
MCTPSCSVSEQEEHYPDYAGRLKQQWEDYVEIAAADWPIRRNLAPGIMSGFYEWKKDGKTKRPFKIHLQNNLIMSVAGIWETWRAGTSSERRSFSILTTAANAFMRNIHDRMPVILAASDEDTWLDPAVYNRGDLQKLLKACPDEWLAAVEISTLVNSPKNNTPDIWQLPAAVGRL